MAALAETHPTLLDLAKRLDPDGTIAPIVEILNQTNEILLDMVWVEGNLPTGHRSTIRTGIPQGTWRKLYGGVQPSKSTTAPVTDTCGMLEAYAEIDKAFADLNGNTAAYRLSEDKAFIEGMNQQMANALFYSNEATNPERFTGFAPRFNDFLNAESADNMIDGGSAGGQTDNASIWLVGWSDATVHGIIPKGSKAGLQHRDLGEVTLESAIDGNGGRMQAYRSHYRWDAGLTVRDWRYVVRIFNIDKSTTLADASSGAKLYDLMFTAIDRLPNLSAVRPVFYMSRDMRTLLRQQLSAQVKQSTLTIENVGGVRTTMFQEIPVRRVDALAADEARIATS